MYFHSMLVSGGEEFTRHEKLQEILTALGFPKQTNFENHQNIAVVSPDEEKLAIGVEKIREVRSWLSIKSNHPIPKVVVIQSAEALTESAQNALLKTLEEPPENTNLILLAKNVNFLLPTIVSRCQLLALSEKSSAGISAKELKENSVVLDWIEEGNMSKGFAWAKENTDRKNCLILIDGLISTGRELSLQNKIRPITIRRLIEAKKYLQANTNVRLTLENLFLN